MSDPFLNTLQQPARSKYLNISLLDLECFLSSCDSCIFLFWQVIDVKVKSIILFYKTNLSIWLFITSFVLLLLVARDKHILSLDLSFISEGAEWNISIISQHYDHLYNNAWSPLPALLLQEQFWYIPTDCRMSSVSGTNSRSFKSCKPQGEASMAQTCLLVTFTRDWCLETASIFGCWLGKSSAFTRHRQDALNPL